MSEEWPTSQDAIDAKRVTPDCFEDRHDECHGWCYCDCHDVLVEQPDPADVPWGSIAQEEGQ